MDDIVSFFVTIGSPALAAYSLLITHLNRCWITAAFLDVEYPNSKHMATVLAAFHHIPIQVEYSSPFLHSLVVLPNNDKFWSQLAVANKIRRWSVPLVMTYVLAIFSVLLSTIDPVSPRPGDIGYSIAAIWAYLLPLIIGWLHIGCEPEPSHLRNSLAAANQDVWVATEQRGHPKHMTCPKAMDFARASGADAEAGSVDLSRNDELKPVPVFNYSRAFVTPINAEVVLRLVKKAAANAKREIPVDNSVGIGEVPVWVKNEEDKISSQNRVGTSTEVVEYCTRVLQLSKRNSGSITQLDIQLPEAPLTSYPLLDHDLVIPCRWAPGIWQRIVVASLLALGLQWGTTGAAVFIHYTSPPVGLGCRSSLFLLYGVAATTSFSLFLTSSILAHMSRPLPGQVQTRSRFRTCQETGATICRRLGKCIAIASAFCILLACFFQVTGAFNNCYCASTNLDNGRHFIIFTGPNFIPGTRLFWLQISGLIAAFVTTILFGFFMYAASPPRR